MLHLNIDWSFFLQRVNQVEESRGEKSFEREFSNASGIKTLFRKAIIPSLLLLLLLHRIIFLAYKLH